MLRDIYYVEIYTILLVLCLVLLAIAKFMFPKRFKDFIAIFFNFRYLKVYGREQKFFDVFEGLLFTNLVMGLALFGIMAYKNLSGLNFNNSEVLFFKFAIGIAVFMLTKVLIERLISSILSLDYIIDNYIFEKISYKNFIGLLLIPTNAIILYSVVPNKAIIFAACLLLISINCIGLILFFKNNLSVIKKHLFYFILYLCALEISPYVILYKSFTIL